VRDDIDALVRSLQVQVRWKPYIEENGNNKLDG